jgi:hypothetical protein
VRPAWLFAAALILSAPAFAQEDEPAAEPEFNCDQEDLPAELAQLCLGLANGYRDALSRPAEFSGAGRPEIKPSLARRPVTQELIGRGLSSTSPDLSRDPFAGPEDRGVGVRMRADGSPVQFSTEMVQPGMAGDTTLNWELKAEHAPETSGMFFGASTGGTYDPESAGGSRENISGFAGLRGIVRPADNVRLGAEVAPRLGSDFATRESSLALEPRLSASSDFDRLGTSDFMGSLNADAAYSMPVDGQPSAWGGLRFTVRPK